MDEIPFSFLRKLVPETRVIKSLKPASQRKLYGAAFTVRVTDESYKAQLSAIDRAKPGGIIVVVGEHESSCLGLSSLQGCRKEKTCRCGYRRCC